MILVLFTKSYPYDFAAEQTFLRNEVPHLVEAFDRVIVVPRMMSGNLLTVPSSVEIENGLAAHLKKHTGIVSIVLRAFGSSSFYQELRANYSLLFQPFKLAKLVLFSGRTALTLKWLHQWLESQHFSEETILYTYWFDEITTALSFVKQKYPQLKLISRAHGYDIYEEEYFPYYWPLRRETLALMDRLFLASLDARDYCFNRYPAFRDLFEACHLGTIDPGFISNASQDGVLRIVSCSHILPLKRIDLLYEGMIHAARIRPGQKFVWHHFGEGKGRKALSKAADTNFSPNVSGHFPGHIPNHEVMNHYREQSVDVFANLSTTEGGAPVSIQEAISCGIPVIATNVGGNPEIVSDRNGMLLDPNPTPEEVAKALLWFCDHPERAQRMRMESRKVWQESYNSEVNFRDFAETLKSIAES